MKLTIFTATGDVGRQLLEQGVAAGHDVTRNPGKLTRQVRTVIAGLAAEPATQAAAAGPGAHSRLGRQGDPGRGTWLRIAPSASGHGRSSCPTGSRWTRTSRSGAALALIRDGRRSTRSADIARRVPTPPRLSAARRIPPGSAAVNAERGRFALAACAHVVVSVVVAWGG